MNKLLDWYVGTIVALFVVGMPNALAVLKAFGIW